MKKQFFYWLAFLIVIVTGCQKEESFELGDSPAAGSLQSDISGDCLPKTVNGTYATGIPLVPTTNTITVSVNVTTTGTYVVTTDTVNGFYFRGVGQFTSLGVNTVTLRGNGTPFAANVTNFVVSFDSTVCDIQVNVISAAVFTLAGAGTPPSCTTPIINGTYAQNVPLTATNTIDLNVNVTTAGGYNVTTTLTNGMTFTGTGNLALGAQTITLVGSGTPTAAGNTTIPVTAGSSTCSFVIPILAPVTGTLGGAPAACTPVTPNGTYGQGIPLTAANTIQIQITTTAGGSYNITTNTAAGISFSGTGSVPAAGTHNVLLTGTGTPNASGPQNFTVTFGTSTCTFSITIEGPAVFTIDCANAVVNGTYQAGVPLGGANSITLPVTVTTAGTYSISETVNGMTFINSGTLALGPTTITLFGSGTPTTAVGSPFNLVIDPPIPACSVPISVTAAPTIDWKFNIGATVYQGSTLDVLFDNTSLPPFTILDYTGDNGAGDDINFSFLDLTGGILANETYSSTSVGLSNGSAFYFLDGAGTLDLTAEPGAPPVGNMVFRITSHNTTTKTIIGTFSGTAFDNISSTTKTITNGTFTAVYP
jgi:hypothetical protein